ncbi:MAG: hypothetical protein Q8P24_15350 [Desulfobacterales bacterium]|nr:hypothetical protein [Desulfobacterales bacterium]
MKKYRLTAIAALTVLILGITAHAKTVTEGTLDIEHLATRISGDLKDYSQKKDVLVDNIKSVQDGIQKLRNDYSKADNEKEKIMLKARTLKESSQLLDFYSQFYSLNIEKVKAILPNLKKMKQSAHKGALGQAARELQNPEFKRNITALYANLSTLAIKFNNPKLKKELASLLTENELLYDQKEKGLNVFNDIIKNIDKVEDYLKSIYARTVLKSSILQRKKVQTELAVQLMQYALALKPIQQAMLSMNPEGVMDVPDIDLAEFIDPIINDDQPTGSGDQATTYDSPGVDAALKNFRKGPNFLK